MKQPCFQEEADCISFEQDYRPVLRIRIRIRIQIHRIHMFLCLLDPDPDPSVIKQI